MGKKKKSVIQGIQTAIQHHVRRRNVRLSIVEQNEEVEDMEAENNANQPPETILAKGGGPEKQIYKERSQVFEDKNIKLTVRQERFRQPQKFDLEDRMFVIKSVPKQERDGSSVPLMISSLHAIHMALKAVLKKLKDAYAKGDRMLYLVGGK